MDGRMDGWTDGWMDGRMRIVRAFRRAHVLGAGRRRQGRAAAPAGHGHADSVHRLSPSVMSLKLRGSAWAAWYSSGLTNLPSNTWRGECNSRLESDISRGWHAPGTATGERKPRTREVVGVTGHVETILSQSMINVSTQQYSQPMQ